MANPNQYPGKSHTNPNSLCRTESNSAAATLVFALRPCTRLNLLVEQAKRTTKTSVGPQVYLDHPPHLTLYVASFDDPEIALSLSAEIMLRWQPPEIEIVGWHHFGGDVLTGNETLVCQLAKPSMAKLRIYQQELISGLQEYRNVRLSQARYLPHFHSLSQERRLAVQSLGFPFVGDDWIPHITIASIEPAKWSAAWNALKHQAPVGVFRFERMSIFRLVDDFPENWKDLEIRHGP